MAGRRKFADGGDPEAIEFSGPELDHVLQGKSKPDDLVAGSGDRGAAAARAWWNQRIDKGKSAGAAEDAATVMRGFSLDEAVPKKKRKRGGPVEGAGSKKRLDRQGRKSGDGNFIAGAIKHPGALHRDLGVPQGEKIPAAKLDAATHSSDPKVARRANFAKTMKKMR